MSLLLGPALGTRLAGISAAWPSDLGAAAGPDLANDEAFASCFGPGWREQLAARGWSAEHPERAWGVRRRGWIFRPGQVPAESSRAFEELAALAAERALSVSGVRAPDVLVLATSTSPAAAGPVAPRVAAALGLACPAYDLRAAGAGGLYALAHAAGLLALGASSALVIGIEVISPWLAPDESWSLLYGDGAVALVLAAERGGSSGLELGLLGRVNPPGRSLTVPGRLPPGREAVDAGAFRLRKPDAEYQVALRAAGVDLARELGAAARARGLAIDRLAPYAVTRDQVEDLRGALGVPQERCDDVLSERGCLGAAGALASLDASIRRTPPRAGETAALCAVAGGITCAGLVWRF